MKQSLHPDPLINRLLQKVVLVYGFDIEHSKDCDNLSLFIYKKTAERISGSTIKRLFGFIKSSSKPNLYTLNLLCKFIDINSFEEFKLNQVQIKKPDNFVKKITKESISSILNKKLIQNYNWIENTSANSRLDRFIDSQKTITTLIGEGGSGKTVCLAQYIEDNSDNILFLTANQLNKLRGNQTLALWVEEIGDSLDVLIIDAIEETAYNFKELNTFFIEFSNFLLTKSSKLKVIFSVRPYTWIKYRHHFTPNECWFDTEFQSTYLKTVQNLNLLDLTEIKNVDEFVNDSILGLIRMPLFYQIYKNYSYDGVCNDWKLLRVFFYEKIWNTTHAFEKKQFFDLILEETNYGVDKSSISRKKIEPLIVRYKKAHLELLSFNFLKETKTLNKFGTFSSVYAFGHEIYFDFIILSHWLEEFNGYTEALTRKIVSTYTGERRVSLLKLLISFGLIDKVDEVKNICELELDFIENQSVIFHMANQIRSYPELQNWLLDAFIENRKGRMFFIERVVDEENLEGFYGEVLKKYLKVVTSSQDIIFACSLLYYNDFLHQRYKENKYVNLIRSQTSVDRIHPFVMGRKYMTLLLDDFVKKGRYSKKICSEISSYLSIDLKESEDELPVHCFGFEHNILHAEFLTGLYHFTPKILNKIENKVLEFRDIKAYDLYLKRIFKYKYLQTIGRLNLAKTDLDFNENKVFSWDVYTLNNYLARIQH